MTFLNVDIFYFLHNVGFKNEYIDGIVIFFAQYAQWFVLALSLYCIARESMRKDPYLYKRYIYILRTYIPVFLSWIVTFVIKTITALPRPFEALSNITPLFVYGGGDTFPSGHATVFSSLATVIYMKDKKMGLMFFVFFICISIARVISGIHYPIDIVIGGIIGTTLTYILIKRYGY